MSGERFVITLVVEGGGIGFRSAALVHRAHQDGAHVNMEPDPIFRTDLSESYQKGRAISHVLTDLAIAFDRGQVPVQTDYTSLPVQKVPANSTITSPAVRAEGNALSGKSLREIAEWKDDES